MQRKTQLIEKLEKNFSYAQLGLFLIRLHKSINEITEMHDNITPQSPIVNMILVNIYNRHTNIDFEKIIREYIANEIKLYMILRNIKA